jgi:ergothioneine biosynthesis protein EgtB
MPRSTPVHKASSAENGPRSAPGSAGMPDASPDSRAAWAHAFAAVRGETERRAAPLTPEDQVVQSMEDASPTKWHRAHTTWFFEQFLLRDHAKDYQPFDERFAYLFNSYYVQAGPRHPRPQRGLITRPGHEEVAAYRAHVDAAVSKLIATASANALPQIFSILEIGLHHEQQHQELLITDILHAFSLNPTAPVYDAQWRMSGNHGANAGYHAVPGGIYRIGHEGDAYSFDNERPAHRVLLQPCEIAQSLVTNAAWLDFIADGGYAKPTLWLSDGWATVSAQGWIAPGYWQKTDETWQCMTLAGLQPVDPAAPVSHVSYYEADAFARWAGKRLPTEAEWEVAAVSNTIDDAFGSVWQWTQSAYSPYPGFQTAAGALGEYNGKFMINQMVLRGSSAATPEGHARASYRNFFPPHARWQFSGVRLAVDAPSA